MGAVRLNCWITTTSTTTTITTTTTTNVAHCKTDRMHVTYNGWSYRTLTGLDRFGTDSDCENTFTILPWGYQVMQYEPDIVEHVVRPYPWNTDGFVFLNHSGWYHGSQ